MDILKNRGDFPILSQKLNQNSLIYLDNAATTQKPQVVIDAMSSFYMQYCSNIHRGINDLAEKATFEYGLARQKVASFIGAMPSETVFTRGTTAAINFIADTWGRQHIGEGDEIILSVMEHHSNILPWQKLAAEKGAILKYIQLNSDFSLDIDQYRSLLSSKTKLVAVSHSSNVLGVINNLDPIISAAKEAGAAILIDAAQSAPYIKIDVKKINCDFLVFSGHKMLSPDGIGVLYIANKWLAKIKPYQVGGGMVANVSADQSEYLSSPEKFEAGTMPIAAAIALGAAVDYYNQNLSWQEFENHVSSLCARLIDGFAKIPQIKIMGNQNKLKKEGHLVSFTIDGFHAHDVAAYLNQFGICVRAGHHCAQPLHDYLGITATVRISFHAYNTASEIDEVLKQLHQLVENGL